MNVIGKYLWEIQNDPAWHHSIEEALSLLEAIQKETIKFSPTDKEELLDLLRISAVKKQRRLTRRILQKQDNWND